MRQFAGMIAIMFDGDKRGRQRRPIANKIARRILVPAFAKGLRRKWWKSTARNR